MTEITIMKSNDNDILRNFPCFADFGCCFSQCMYQKIKIGTKCQYKTDKDWKDIALQFFIYAYLADKEMNMVVTQYRETQKYQLLEKHVE